MDIVLLLKEDFKELKKELVEIKQILLTYKDQLEPKNKIIDNEEFIKLMNISSRTAQTWRDQGKVTFYQINHKIYYDMKSIHELLEKNKIQAFKKK